MLAIAVTYKTKPGKREGALRAARICASKTKCEIGNVDYTFYSGIDDDQTFFLFEHWESREALDSHLKSPHLAEFRAALKEMLEVPAAIRVYEVSSFKNGL